MPPVASPLPLLRLDAFVMGAGTGGCLAGVSLFLRDKRCPAKMYLVDPPGSALFNRVRHGVCYSHQMSERGVKKHRCEHDTSKSGTKVQCAVDGIDSAFRYDCLEGAGDLVCEVGRFQEVGRRCHGLVPFGYMSVHLRRYGELIDDEKLRLGRVAPLRGSNAWSPGSGRHDRCNILRLSSISYCCSSAGGDSTQNTLQGFHSQVRTFFHIRSSGSPVAFFILVLL